MRLYENPHLNSFGWTRRDAPEEDLEGGWRSTTFYKDYGDGSFRTYYLQYQPGTAPMNVRWLEAP